MTRHRRKIGSFEPWISPQICSCRNPAYRSCYSIRVQRRPGASVLQSLRNPAGSIINHLATLRYKVENWKRSGPLPRVKLESRQSFEFRVYRFRVVHYWQYEALLEFGTLQFLNQFRGCAYVAARPFGNHDIQVPHIEQASLAIAAGIGPEIGEHTFRHTSRSWLDAAGAPLKVQQELMRHASITTTMNVYGRAMPGIKREANSKVVSFCRETRSKSISSLEEAAESSPGRKPGVGSRSEVEPRRGGTSHCASWLLCRPFRAPRPPSS